MLFPCDHDREYEQVRSNQRVNFILNENDRVNPVDACL